MSTIHFEEIGHGDLMYFIHGNGLNVQSMQAFYEPAFPPDSSIRRVYLDIPGMGESSLAPTSQNSDDILAVIASFITDHSNGTNFSLCGHSYGAYLCLGLASQLPQAKSVFLTCPVVKARQSDRRTASHFVKVNQPVHAIQNQHYLTDFMAMNTIITPQSWIAYQKAILPGLKKGIDPFWTQITDEDYAFTFEDQLATQLTHMRGIILLGNLDHIVGYQDQTDFAAKLPAVQVQSFSNSGHNLPLDEPEKLTQIFQQFIRESVIDSHR